MQEQDHTEEVCKAPGRSDVLSAGDLHDLSGYRVQQVLRD